MRDYEAEARAAIREGEARGLDLRAQALRDQARELRRDPVAERKAADSRRTYIEQQVAAGRMCPGGCDTAVGGCIKHADGC